MLHTQRLGHNEREFPFPSMFVENVQHTLSSITQRRVERSRIRPRRGPLSFPSNDREAGSPWENMPSRRNANDSLSTGARGCLLVAPLAVLHRLGSPVEEEVPRARCTPSRRVYIFAAAHESSRDYLPSSSQLAHSARCKCSTSVTVR